jgi:peptide-methionine (S)-S-oxide reductase
MKRARLEKRLIYIVKNISAVGLMQGLLMLSLPAFSVVPAQTDTAVFAGGCFWTMQSDFDKVPGVIKTTAGYTGGNVANPSYEQVETGKTGHYESVQVVYDPAKVSYSQLLNVYWHNIDPTNAEGQFCDIGSQYRSAIFYNNENQNQLATDSKQQLIHSGRIPQVVTQILPATSFYPAEGYHQAFYRKHPVQYSIYKYGCGRDHTLKKLWEKASW